MASFQAKIGRKMISNIENKNYRFVSFLPRALQKIPKKFKIPLWIHFQPNLVGEG